MIRYITLLLLGAASLNTTAQKSDCSNCTVYKGYISGDMTIWKKGMGELEAAYERTHDACSLYSLTEARYGYIGYMLGAGKKSEAKPLVEAFESDIDRLSGYTEYRAESEAFRVALYGFMMGLNPARTITLGPKTIKQLEKAMATDLSSPSVWIEKANSESYMPAFAGGSKAKAAESFREALRLFENDRNLSGCSWRYLNTMVLLGQLLEKMEDYSGARDIYKKALAKEPGFSWVRNELLPAVERKIK